MVVVLSIRPATTKQSTLTASIPAARMSTELREPSQPVNDQEEGGSPGFIQSGTLATLILCCKASAYQSGKGAKNPLVTSLSSIRKSNATSRVSRTNSTSSSPSWLGCRPLGGFAVPYDSPWGDGGVELVRHLSESCARGTDGVRERAGGLSSVKPGGGGWAVSNPVCSP